MTHATREKLTDLLRAARAQGGVFTASEAGRHGVSRKTLRQLAREGEGIVRAFRGVYQAIDVPYDQAIAAAWRRAGTDSVASHETALQLYDLADIEPRRYEFTIPRAARARRPGSAFRLHTTTAMPASRSIRGVPVTTPARAIVDTAPLGDLTEIAVAQALGRGLATEEELRREAAARPRAVQDAIDRALSVRDRYEAYV